MKKYSKKAAIEMSMSTIVVIVLSVTILIFGMIFIKNIMCSGIIMTEQIDQKVTNEIQDLFGASDYGIKCMGEDGQEITIGDGGKRQIVCIINTDTQQTYTLTVKKVESLSGTPTAKVQSWILKDGWTGVASPGKKTVTALILQIPKGTSATNLDIEIEEYIHDTGVLNTHNLYIDVNHVSGLTSSIC